MTTISVISSISFNTEEFFERVVEKLTAPSSPIIDWCHWVKHLPDTDQTKAHIHFVCKPSKRLDTNALRKEFLELTLESPDKPLGCLPFVKTTSIKDWLLYAIHEPGYLFRKGQSRNTHYEKEAVKSSDPDFLATQWEETADPLQGLMQRVYHLRKVEGLSFFQVLAMGIIPPNLIGYFRTFEDAMNRDTVVRNSPWAEDIEQKRTERV